MTLLARIPYLRRYYWRRQLRRIALRLKEAA